MLDVAAVRAPQGDGEVAALEERLFLEALFQRYGYDLRGYATRSMHRRLGVALARSGLPDLGALQHRVLTDREAFSRVLADLTVRVTELFRDPALHRFFRARVVPVLRTYPRVSIWHAGCASGEEAYSMAVLLREEGLLGRAHLYATDLAPEAVVRAKEGVFEAPDTGVVEAAYRRAGGATSLEAHATIAYGQLAFAEALRNKILFFEHDLVADAVFAEVQVVLCRNVLIYFGAALRERVVRKLGESLCAGGFLCLGKSERLGSDARGRFHELGPEERVYRLRGAA